MAIREPSFKDILEARRTISKYLHPTPLIKPRTLGERLGCEAYLKLENLQPIGAFKVRGGINLFSSLSEREARKGVVAVSTGNHGQSIAYAGKLFGIETTIVVPEQSNSFKIQAIKSLGAKVIFHGKDFDEARLWAEKNVRRDGGRYVHSANESLLLAGVGTAYLEILEELPDVDIIIVPIGGGSGACGACIVAKTINRNIKVIGVQAEGAPAFYLSWKNKRLMHTDYMRTSAEGLATRFAFELPLRILNRLLDDVVLVSDREMRQSIRLILEDAHQIAEAAGAAPTAVARKIPNLIHGKKVVLMLSGGNVTREGLVEAMNEKLD